MMQKLLVMKIAGELTIAACGSAPNPVSPDLSDPGTRAKNLEVWETFRAFYIAVSAALTDDKDWVPPVINLGPMVQNVVASLKPLVPELLAAAGPLLTGDGPLAGFAALAMGALSKAGPALANLPHLPGNLPMPGAAPIKLPKLPGH